MNYKLVLSELAKGQLEALYYYIAEDSSGDIARSYIKDIVAYCNNLCIFPLRGTIRDDLRPGVRITSYRKRVVIAFEIQGDDIIVVGVFYGGQDYETLLSGESAVN